MSVFDSIESSHVAAILTNPRLPDNPIIACNDAFVALTGYARDELIGRNCRLLSGPDTESDARAALRDAIAACTPVLVELTNYRKDGTAFRNAVMIAPIFDPQGDLEYFLGSQMPVTAAPVADAGSRELALARMAPLSRRQRQILIAMAAGQSTKQIAFALDLRERTVKMHRAALLKGLGVRSGVEAIRIAIEAGY